MENGGTYLERNFLSCLLFYQDRWWFCKWFSCVNWVLSIVYSIWGMEIPLLLKFSCPEQKTFEKVKSFVDSLYDYDYSGVNKKETSDKEEAAIVIETDQSKSVSHTTADYSKLVSYTDSSSEEEDLHIDVNFDEPIDLAIN